MASGISKTNKRNKQRKKNKTPQVITVGWLQQATDPSRYSNYELLFFNDSPFKFLLGVSMLQCLPNSELKLNYAWVQDFPPMTLIVFNRIKKPQREKQTKLCLWVWGSKAIMAFLWFLNIYTLFFKKYYSTQWRQASGKGGRGQVEGGSRVVTTKTLDSNPDFHLFIQSWPTFSSVFLTWNDKLFLGTGGVFLLCVCT